MVEGQQRRSFSNEQEDSKEKLISTAIEIGQNLIVQKLQLSIVGMKESMLSICKKKNKKKKGLEDVVNEQLNRNF